MMTWKQLRSVEGFVDQLTPICEQIAKKCGQSKHYDAGHMITTLQDKLQSGNAYAIAGCSSADSNTIAAIFLLEYRTHPWFSFGFIAISMAWSGARLKRKDYTSLQSLIDDAAMKLNAKYIIYETWRSKRINGKFAFERIAESLGYKLFGIAFQKEIKT